MTLPSQIHMFNRNGTYYFRRRIPKDLLSLYPTEQIIFSLKTKDRREADRLARIESVKLDQEFLQRRSSLPDNSLEDISDEQIEQICNLWIAYVLEEDEEVRMDGLSDRDYRKMQETLDIVNAGDRDNLAKGDTELIEFELEDFCESHGYKIAKNFPSYKKLAYKFLEANLETTQKMLARQKGEIVKTPKIPVTEISQSSLALHQVLSKWKLEAKPKPKTVAEWKLVISRFNDQHGTLKINQITKAHIVAFKDSRLKSGNASATVTKQLGALSSLLQYSVDNDFINSNVAAGVRVARSKVEKRTRLPYEIEDLTKIFSCPIYTNNQRPQGGGKEAAYWLPLLALYSGARLEELGQLQKKDVRQQNSIWYINISDDTEGASLKTYSSRRNIPIHPELLRFGFINYVNQQHKRIFPALKLDNHNSLTGNFSKWWGRYARETIGITDKRKVFHSFRHAFKDACRNSGIHQEIHDSFTGHAGINVGNTYGSGASLKRLASQIAKLKYEGLKIG